MTDKQVELLNKAKAILKILSPLSEGDRTVVAQIVYQLTEAEDRSRREAEQGALVSEKLAYMNKAGETSAIGAAVPFPGGGLFRG